ncbi:energy transducer TonB [Methylosinus sp.]|jgi:protein TonB|uniref:energy transducer TonB n=1 Tax=Methylosinus sp. TaxID=427 RepID=UPI002F93F367
MRLSSFCMVAGLISVSALGAAAAKDRAHAAPSRSAAPAIVQGYKSLLAMAIRRHTPSLQSIGRGHAFCSFEVGRDGRIIILEATGSSPAHAMLARRIIESVHAPPPPGGPFHAEQSFHFF